MPQSSITTDQSHDEARWRAVLARDASSDGQFVTGVMSTGIYCRPSCPARHPRRENVRFFPSPAQADAAGLRPCKRCRPDSMARDHEAVLQAVSVLQSAEGVITLAQLGDVCGYSPGHLQRVFTRAVGLSPSAYARALRAERAGNALSEGMSVTQASYDAGYGAMSRFYEDSGKRMGMTPSAWKKGGEGVTIHWAVVETSLGQVLIAATDKGVCRLSFGEGPEELSRRFPQADLAQGGNEFEALCRAVIAAVEHPGHSQQIPLDVQGTAFQEAVWRQLREIPPGETRSYGDIAAAIGKPGAVRAAGSANGANPVAVLVPCHRVVRSDGGIGGYAYGDAIKRELLRREAAEQYGDTD